MASTDDAGCSGAGSHLTTPAILGLQDQAADQDRVIKKIPGMEDTFYLNRQFPAREKVDLLSSVLADIIQNLDDFLNDRRVGLDWKSA